MLLDIVFLVAGLAILYFGAEFLVKGASQLALNLGITPMIVGLTVVAFGTSAPEFVISLIAAIDGAEGISVGNIVGSNIANIALILGIAALISPMPVDAHSLRTDYPIMFITSIVFYVMALNGEIARWEGGILFAGIIAYVAWMIVRSRRSRHEGAAAEAEEGGEISAEDVEAAAKSSRLKNIGLVVLGLVGLVGGSKLMVDGAVSIAKAFGISELVIGLTIVAVGTSLPELATSVVAAIRKEADISIGNVVGSNIFNVLFIMGLVPLIFGMKVEARAISLDFPVMLGIAVVTFPLLRIGYRLTRLRGAVLLLIYIAYVVSLFAFPAEPAAPPTS